ncbi:MAG TPA: serine/threonine-protein kinase, partial [Steroidobacteraceae bacterium]
AIKFLSLAVAGPAGEERFRREGSALARLTHPNIARLLDAGVSQIGLPYLVLEYVEGQPIDEWCDAHKTSIDGRLRLFQQVLDAVADAHAHFIVHRDLKPANILVTDDGTVKLLDFGIAKLLDDTTGATALTKSGGTALTPQFAAPEQLLGGAVTTATDIYSLGQVLYVLLTGRPPILAESDSSAQLIRAVLTEDAPQASSITSMPISWRRSLQGDLDNILGKALKKVPMERYASVDAFADDLKRYLTHEPVKARADTVTYRLTKFVRRHRGGVLSGLLTVLVLCAATITTFLQKLEADRQRDAAQFEARHAESANEFLDFLLQSDNAASQGAPQSPAARIELGARMLELEYRGDPRFAGRMLVELSDEYRGQTLTRQAVALDARAYILGRDAQDPELMALAQCEAAYAETTAGVTENASERLAEAKRLITQLDRPPVVLQVLCRRADAELAVRTGNLAAAEQILQEARSLLEESGQTYRLAYTSVLNDLGGVYNNTRRLAQALAMAELIGATHEKYGRGGTKARLIALQNASVVQFNMGEIKASVVAIEEVRRRFQAIQGDPSEPLSMISTYAERLVRLGRLQEGLEVAGTARTQARSSGNRLWLLFALRTMCTAYIELGRLPEAESTIQETASAVGNGPAMDARFLGLLDRLRGLLELQRGDAAAALQSANASLAAITGGARTKTLAEGASLILAARAALASGRSEDGEQFARRLLVAAESVARGPDTSADVGEALLLLAKAEIAQGRAPEAQPLLERAARCLTNGLGADHAMTREALALAAHKRA